MKKLLLFALLLYFACAQAQQGPWENPLRIAWSADGTTFGPSVIFQDSAGVPSVIQWKGDTLIAAFQWFRLPQNSPSWDRVAVKFSYDSGLSWTSPHPIIVDGLPPAYQRPFDPTLALFGEDSLRIYFSSSNGSPMGGLNELVDTYSAKSIDGIHYTFEPNARVDVANRPVIDPAVIFFNNAWHYTAPIGAPQEGAHHYISQDGLNFTAVPSIPSDMSHNWTGNMMRNNGTTLRFYGSGPMIWFNSSSNGGQWNGFEATNVKGGDPSVIQIAPDSYLMVFVGQHLSTDTQDPGILNPAIYLAPNPVIHDIHLLGADLPDNFDFEIIDPKGNVLRAGHSDNCVIEVRDLAPGFYFLRIGKAAKDWSVLRFVKTGY